MDSSKKQLVFIICFGLLVGISLFFSIRLLTANAIKAIENWDGPIIRVEVVEPK